MNADLTVYVKILYSVPHIGLADIYHV